MFYRLLQLLFLLGFCFIHSFEWDLLFNLDDNDKLLCYSCRGNECRQVTDHDQNKVICNKKTQLCWAGFVDQQPYRTCASRYCTPSDISLDSHIRIETCCRSNFCNSVSLSRPIAGKSYRKNSSRIRTKTSTVTQTTTAATTSVLDYFIREMANAKPPISMIHDSHNSEDDGVYSTTSQMNATDSNSYRINWEHLSYDKDFNNGVASISSILLFLMPLLLVLLF